MKTKMSLLMLENNNKQTTLSSLVTQRKTPSRFLVFVKNNDKLVLQQFIVTWQLRGNVFQNHWVYIP